MTTAHTVPANVEADSIIDLVSDCREISGLIGGFLPTPYPAADRMPASDAALSVEALTAAAAGLDGYDVYGS